MDKKEIIIKLIILDIFPSLEEVNDNNSEIITISFQDNDLSYELADLLSSKKELDLTFPQNTTNAKINLNKEEILYASGLLPIKNSDQWVTLSYENKKPIGNSSLALSLINCIKLKINCKIISGDAMMNMNESNFSNIIKKNKAKLNQKKMTALRKLNNENHVSQELLVTEENVKPNKLYESESKSPQPNPYTTINKNHTKKIELSEMKANKKATKFNYSSLRNENIKNLSLAIPSTSKNSFKNGSKKNGGPDSVAASLSTEMKPKHKNRAEKRSYEEINNLDLNTKKMKNNKSSIGIHIKNSNSTKNIKKRKSDAIQQINLIDNITDQNKNKKEKEKEKEKEKNNKKNKKEKNNLNKKKSCDNVNKINTNSEDKLMKSSRMNNNELKNITKSSEMFKGDGKLYNLLTENKNENDNNKANKNENENENEIFISHDVENIQDDDNSKIKNDINNINNISNMNDLNEDEIEPDIFSKQLEDFQLLYSDEYIKSINNDYIKLEIELFIEKIIELTSLYNNQIEEKDFEYQILKNNYFKNISLFIEMQKLLDKLRIIRTQYNLKKHNLKEINMSHFSNSINNLITNKQEIKIFKTNFINEVQNKINKKKEMLKQIIKKLIEKDKNKNILNKNERFQIWIKNNCIKEDKRKKDKNLKNQKQGSKKGLPINNNMNNKKLVASQTKYGKFKNNKLNEEDKGKNKNKSRTKK